jgi:hypothetical protein
MSGFEAQFSQLLPIVNYNSPIKPDGYLSSGGNGSQ